MGHQKWSDVFFFGEAPFWVIDSGNRRKRFILGSMKWTWSVLRILPRWFQRAEIGDPGREVGFGQMVLGLMRTTALAFLQVKVVCGPPPPQIGRQERHDPVLVGSFRETKRKPEMLFQGF